jgi:hypothetical protein
MKTARGLSPTYLVVLAALVSLAAKLYCAWTTTGTGDAVLFGMYATTIQRFGVLAMYHATPLFNHTPMIGEMIATALRISQATESSFFFWLRLPGILADLGSVFAILWIRARTGQPPWWACALFALSPVSFMVSGYHGNVDSLLVFFTLLAACACVAERPVMSAALLAIACNVKIVPLVLTPVFFFFWLHRGQARKFVVAFAALMLLAWAAPLCLTPTDFARNVLSYSSYWGEWGVTYTLHQTGVSAFQTIGYTDLPMTEKIVMTFLKAVIVGGMVWLGWSRRSGEPAAMISTLALGWMVFFVFAPGVAPQYLVWFAPFLLVHSPRWYAAITAACSVYLVVFYTLISRGIPWNYGNSTLDLAPTLRLWAALPWLTLTAFLAISIREYLPASPARESEAQPQTSA